MTVNDIVLRAVQSINVKKTWQALEINYGDDGQTSPFTLTHRDVQHFVGLLRQHPPAVDKLVINQCRITRQALEVLRGYFTSRAMSLSFVYLYHVNLGNQGCWRLLSGLNGNTSTLKMLSLFCVGLEGRAGGAILSSILQHHPRLLMLCCVGLRLDVEGAAAGPSRKSNHGGVVAVRVQPSRRMSFFYYQCAE